MNTSNASGMEGVNAQLSAELKSFSDLWHGGYYEGDPLDPRSGSNYPLEFSFMSVLHVAYLVCIKPYVNAESSVIEIGPGRGGWTKAILAAGAREVYCLDALSAEHNGFWEYVENRAKTRYFQVADFECNDLPDNSFDFLFSFGCLCHVSPEGVEAYFRNMHRKLREGAHGFVMVADYDKYNRAVRNGREGGLTRNMFRTKRLLPIRLQMQLIERLFYPKNKSAEESTEARPGRWYHLGTERACEMLKRFGYDVLDQDVGVNYRDPVIHFRKL